MVLAALVVNARMLLYSAALAPHAADWPRALAVGGAYLLADPVYALADRPVRGTGRTAAGPRDRFAYYLSRRRDLWVAWLASPGPGCCSPACCPPGCGSTSPRR